jgi:hypothetical protein
VTTRRRIVGALDDPHAADPVPPPDLRWLKAGAPLAA